MKPACTWLLLLGSVLGASGCDSVGAPLVDYRKLHDGGTFRPVRCGMTPACEPPEDDRKELRLVLPVDLAACREAKPNCEPRPDEPADGGVAALDADTLDAGTGPDTDAGADASASAPDGVAASGLDALEGPARAACKDNTGADVQLQELDCAERAVGDASAADIGDDALEGVRWHDSNVSLKATSARKIVLSDAELENVLVTLHGPVTLRVEHGNIARLSVAARASADGEPRLELEDVHGSDLIVGDSSGAFEGSILVRDTHVESAQLLSDALTLETVHLTDGAIDARSLDAADATLEQIEIGADRALLSAFTLTHSPITRCGVLSLIAGHLFQSDLPECADAPARLFDTSFVDGALDGDVECDNCDVETSRLGTRSPTEIVAWGGSLSTVTFCAQFGRLRMWETVVRCSSCEDALQEPGPVCAIRAYSPDKFRYNYCPLLAELAEQTTLPRCEEPLPERIRPYD